MFTMTSAVFVLGMWIVSTSHAAIISVTVLIGFFTGGLISLLVACVANIKSHGKIRLNVDSFIHSALTLGSGLFLVFRPRR